MENRLLDSQGAAMFTISAKSSDKGTKLSATTPNY